MLKHGRIFPRKKGWTMRYLCWLQAQQFDHPAHQIALQEMVEAVRVSKEWVERLERVIEEFVPAWSLAPIVRALRARASSWVSRPRPWRAIDWPDSQTGRHHQGGERSGSPHVGRERMDL